MTDAEKIEHLTQQNNVLKLERETLLRIIRELWEIICRYDSERL